MTMKRVFSGIQPSGDPHLGNYLGAMRNYVRMQDGHDAVYCVVDLHAVTTPQDPAELRANTLRMGQWLMATGLDPERCILFVQSQVPQHAQLGWLMEASISFGELSRMTQFKDKSDRHSFISSALFTYPALQAADILLYDTDFVPVGDDQRQHLELARDAAERFNSRYGDTLVVPEHVIPQVAARVMDLQRPHDKMSKSAEADNGLVMVTDDPKRIEKKFKRAVTDSDDDVRFDRVEKPGVSNLLDILGAVTDRDPAALADDYTQYGRLKVDTAEAVIAMLEPIQARFAEIAADPAESQRQLAIGADKATEIAAEVYGRAANAIGFLGKN
jgi:tryptophanyl-tRNA synthetase